MIKNPYETLGVSQTAKQEEIRGAYRKLAKRYHPDLNPGNKEAERKFKEINSAYELLENPERRAKFDRGETEETAGQAEPRYWERAGQGGPYYHRTQQGGGRYSSSFGGKEGVFDEDVFAGLFGGGAGRRAHGGGFDIPGQDQIYEMDIEFKDAILGAEQDIGLPGGKKLRVKIPPGIESGTKLRFSGQGGQGVGKAPPGDAYVQIRVRPSRIYRRVGNDLEMELPISLPEAVLGGEVRVPTIDGAVLLKIPSNVTSDSKLRITGKGVPIPRQERRGDQIVILKIAMPPKVDPELRHFVEEWNKKHPYNPRTEL